LRTSIFKTISNTDEFKSQLLSWSEQHREIVFLDSNHYPLEHQNYECILAVDAFTSIKTDYHNAFDDLKQYQSITKDWLFGYLAYDLKNDTEDLVSNNQDFLLFPDLFFFQPKKLFLLKDNQLEICYLTMYDDEIEDDIISIKSQITNHKYQSEVSILNAINVTQRIPKEFYLEKVSEILKHIHYGTIYEANFCMEFFAHNANINTIETFEKLDAISEAPFAVYFKNDVHYLLSASPERYICKKGSTIISQPIKGTAKRYTTAELDEKSKRDLEQNPKERAENIMIVDLVRNDLSHTAEKGSVKVAELCKIYSFKQVHQMISTITSEVSHTTAPVDIIKTSFPMGSMTGAPKISAMKLIETYEETKRGLYSGAVGYFTPTGDFDFNVVIRSILYNAAADYVSFSVGSAITSASTPESEYEECLLKAKAMLTVLS
jgi:para-aminobenzoate synthetase component I